MSVATRPLTYDDLILLPDDGKRYEIIGGELIVSPAPILDHQDVLGLLYALFLGWVKPRRLGKVFVAPVDLVVEILSPSTRQVDQVRKAALYATAGVREYWQVDLDAGAIMVLILDGGHYPLTAWRTDAVHSTVLSGFTVDVAALFAGTE